MMTIKDFATNGAEKTRKKKTIITVLVGIFSAALVTTIILVKVGLKSDGTVLAAGNNEAIQCNVSGWTDVIAVAAGGYTVGLKSDGTVVAVSFNGIGQRDVHDWTDIVAIIHQVTAIRPV